MTARGPGDPTPAVTVATAEGLVQARGGAAAGRLADRGLAAMTVAGDTWWVADEDNRILRGGSDGFEEVARLEGGPVTALLAGSVPGDLLVGTAGAHLFLLAGGELTHLEGFEATPGRSAWYTPWGGPPAVRSLAVADDTVYANVHVGGIARSRDGGASWEPTVDIDVDVHEVRTVASAGLVVAAAGAGGLLVSDDGGGDWQRYTRGMQATYCRAVAATADHLLVSSSRGPGGGAAGVYRTGLERPGTLERCRGGLPDELGGNVDTGWLDAAGRWAGLVTADGDVYLSGDEGSSWRPVAEGLPAPVTLRVGGGGA